MRYLTRAVLSVLFAMATLAVFAALKLLPYSRTRDVLTDAVALPGGLLAFIFFPEGVHTGAGSPNWGIVAFAGNVMCYSILWFVVLTLWRRRAAVRKRSLPPD